MVQLYADKVAGNLSDTEFNIIKSSNTIEIDKLNNRLTDIDNDILNLRTDKEKQIDKEKLFEQYKDITELNRVVLDSFISKIEIGKPNSETSTRLHKSSKSRQYNRKIGGDRD